MNPVIMSPGNPRIKELVKLRESPRRRRETKSFLVEGAEELLALAKAGRKLREVYFCPSMVERKGENEALEELRNLGVSMQETADAVQAKAAYRSGGSGLIGVAETWSLSLNEFSPDPSGPLVILDEVEKPGNLGAIIRSIEAFGAAGLILCDHAVDFFNPNVVRSSRGLMAKGQVGAGSKEETWEWIKGAGREVVATSAKATEDLRAQSLPAAAALLFGSEREGLGSFWRERVGKWARIPMRGTASSLNLNVSVSCMLYEYFRS